LNGQRRHLVACLRAQFPATYSLLTPKSLENPMLASEWSCYESRALARWLPRPFGLSTSSRISLLYDPLANFSLSSVTILCCPFLGFKGPPPVE